MRFLPLLLLVACYTQDAWVDTVGQTWCARDRQCNPDDFDATYNDMKDCKSQWSDVWADYDACLAEAGCTFDSKEAAACGKAVAQADCDSISSGAWGDACTDVYSCTAGDAIQAGLCAIGF